MSMARISDSDLTRLLSMENLGEAYRNALLDLRDSRAEVKQAAQIGLEIARELEKGKRMLLEVSNLMKGMG